MKRPSSLVRLLFLAALLAAVPATAQTYPSRPVRILVPLAAGGGMDTVTRSLSQKLSDSYGQTVVVDHRPGAGSLVALEILANAAPDGYTLAMISATTVIYPLLYKSRFDVARDFTAVAQMTAQGYALVVHPSIPAKSVAQLVDYIRARPGQLNYASSGIGSPIHMTTELFQSATKTRMTHVPFKGMGAAYGDLLGGRIQLSFATIISSLAHVKAGRLRALAVTPDKRAPIMPEVPTLKEAGVPVVVVNWYGLIAPPRTPKTLVGEISAQAVKAMQAPEMAKRLIAEGSEAVTSSPSAFAAHLRDEQAQWRRVIQEANIRPQ